MFRADLDLGEGVLSGFIRQVYSFPGVWHLAHFPFLCALTSTVALLCNKIGLDGGSKGFLIGGRDAYFYYFSINSGGGSGSVAIAFVLLLNHYVALSI